MTLPAAAESADQAYGGVRLLAFKLGDRLLILQEGLLREDDIEITHESGLVAVCCNLFRTLRALDHGCLSLLLIAQVTDGGELIFNVATGYEDVSS